VTDRDLERAHLANAVFDAHRDDPEFGHRLLGDEAREAGHQACDRTVWRICRDNAWWSVFGKKRGKNGKRPGPPAHDDLVRRDFTATGPNELWLTDITEHPTAEGKLYLCAIKDVYSNRIVGYSISDRMKSRLAVDALASAVARRAVDVAGCTVHSDRGSQFRSRKFLAELRRHDLLGSMGQVASQATTRRWSRSSRCCRRTSWTGAGGPPVTSCAWRSSPGSNGPITAAGARPDSAAEPASACAASGPR